MVAARWGLWPVVRWVDRCAEPGRPGHDDSGPTPVGLDSPDVAPRCSTAVLDDDGTPIVRPGPRATRLQGREGCSASVSSTVRIDCCRLRLSDAEARLRTALPERRPFYHSGRSLQAASRPGGLAGLLPLRDGHRLGGVLVVGLWNCNWDGRTTAPPGAVEDDVSSAPTS